MNKRDMQGMIVGLCGGLFLVLAITLSAIGRLDHRIEKLERIVCPTHIDCGKER